MAARKPAAPKPDPKRRYLVTTFRYVVVENLEDVDMETRLDRLREDGSAKIISSEVMLLTDGEAYRVTDDLLNLPVLEDIIANSESAAQLGLRLGTAERLLEQVEAVHQSHNFAPECPICGARQVEDWDVTLGEPAKHKPGCELAAFLGRGA